MGLLIHTVSVADDEPGMVDLTFRVPIDLVFLKSLADLNSEGSLWGWAGLFQEAALEAQS